MLRPRIIPCLLLKDGALVKGVNFKDHKYIGNPMNAIRIFSKKGADELIILDIEASLGQKQIDANFIRRVADECYIPFSVGGGIKDIETASNLIMQGAEKVVICTSAIENPGLITELSKMLGSQSVVVSIDAKKNEGKYFAYTHCGQSNSGLSALGVARKSVELGAGEIIINSIDRDGTYLGYDEEIINAFSKEIKVSLICCGGASEFEDFKKVIRKVDAVSAGSMFVYYGRNRAVLINFPNNKQKEDLTQYKWRQDGDSGM